jgi:hypothetical protein
VDLTGVEESDASSRSSRHRKNENNKDKKTDDKEKKTATPETKSTTAETTPGGEDSQPEDQTENESEYTDDETDKTTKASKKTKAAAAKEKKEEQKGKEKDKEQEKTKDKAKQNVKQNVKENLKENLKEKTDDKIEKTDDGDTMEKTDDKVEQPRPTTSMKEPRNPNYLKGTPTRTFPPWISSTQPPTLAFLAHSISTALPTTIPYSIATERWQESLDIERALVRDCISCVVETSVVVDVVMEFCGIDVDGVIRLDISTRWMIGSRDEAPTFVPCYLDEAERKATLERNAADVNDDVDDDAETDVPSDVDILDEGDAGADVGSRQMLQMGLPVDAGQQQIMEMMRLFQEQLKSQQTIITAQQSRMAMLETPSNRKKQPASKAWLSHPKIEALNECTAPLL